MVRKINEQHPDLVVNAGDLVNIDARELTDSVMSVLSGIRAKDGVYSVYGNHDLGIYLSRDSDLTPRQSFDELAVRQRAMGWNLLDNESRYVRRGSDSISVTGVDMYMRCSSKSGSADGRGRLPNGCTIDGAVCTKRTGNTFSSTTEWDT